MAVFFSEYKGMYLSGKCSEGASKAGDNPCSLLLPSLSLHINKMAKLLHETPANLAEKLRNSWQTPKYRKEQFLNNYYVSSDQMFCKF